MFDKKISLKIKSVPLGGGKTAMLLRMVVHMVGEYGTRMRIPLGVSDPNCRVRNGIKFNVIF